MSILSSRLLSLHRMLDEAKLAHAFGGAICLAYWTLEPRGTRDLDVNVFVDADRSGDTMDALSPAFAISKSERRAAKSHGQVRVFWDRTPIDLFFNTDAFHEWAARNVKEVEFEGRAIPILSGESLMVFKAMFDRTRDWADIEAMLEAGLVDPSIALGHLRAVLGSDHEVVGRLQELLAT